MGNSLQEQLLKAGLVNAHQVRQKQTQRRKNKQQGKSEDEARREQLRQEMARKQAEDRALNQEREREAQRKAEAAALRELIHTHRLARDNGEVAYNFVDDGALKRLYVKTDQQQALVAGELAIVRQDHFYELIPAAIAERVAERNAALILVWNRPEEGGNAEADDYADYQVPDDLMW